MYSQYYLHARNKSKGPRCWDVVTSLLSILIDRKRSRPWRVLRRGTV